MSILRYGTMLLDILSSSQMTSRLLYFQCHNRQLMKHQNRFLPLLARCGIAASLRLHFNYSSQAVSSAVEDGKLDKMMHVMLELVE